MVHILRNLSPAIFDLSPLYFVMDYNRKEVPAMQKLLGYNLSTKKYSTWSLILYPEETFLDNDRYRFRNPKLATVFFFFIIYAWSN